MANITLNIKLSGLALKLRYLRLSNDYTFEKLQALTDIPAIDLQNFELDKEVPHKKELKKLAEVYDVDWKIFV